MLLDEKGRRLADYDMTGSIMGQPAWMGDYLIGLVKGSKLLYVEPDHLGSPRAMIDPTRNVTVRRWRPTDDPFGTALPDEDSDADGMRFVFDLRFPGQRYDAVTGLYYNYYRDYDADAGRYAQVDPIGLAGGINPYVYANGSPLRYVDPNGTNPVIVAAAAAAVGAAASAVGNGVVQLAGIAFGDECRKFNWRELGLAAVGGGISGASLPFVGPVGAAGIGGVTNVGMHLANDGDYRDERGMFWAGLTGVIGGAIGGNFAKGSRYGYGGTAASREMVDQSNLNARLRQNVSASNFTRSASGAIPANVPAGGGSKPCGCDQ